MSTTDHYKQMAAQCIVRANNCGSAPERNSYLELALVWSKLAEHERELEPARKTTPQNQKSP